MNKKQPTYKSVSRRPVAAVIALSAVELLVITIAICIRLANNSPGPLGGYTSNTAKEWAIWTLLLIGGLDLSAFLGTVARIIFKGTASKQSILAITILVLLGIMVISIFVGLLIS